MLDSCSLSLFKVSLPVFQCVRSRPPPPLPSSVEHSNDAAGAAGVASADEGNGVVEGHGRVRGAELVRMIVRGRGRR